MRGNPDAGPPGPQALNRQPQRGTRDGRLTHSRGSRLRSAYRALGLALTGAFSVLTTAGSRLTGGGTEAAALGETCPGPKPASEGRDRARSGGVATAEAERGGRNWGAGPSSMPTWGATEPWRPERKRGPEEPRRRCLSPNIRPVRPSCSPEGGPPPRPAGSPQRCPPPPPVPLCSLSPSAALGYSVELGRTPLFRKNALHLLRPHQLAPRFPAPLRGSVS